MKEYRLKPDFIKKETPVIDLGHSKPEKVVEDELIPKDKTSNIRIINNGYWVKINKELLYFKVPISNFCMLKELLGVKVTEYFNLPSVQYKIAQANWELGNETTTFYGVVSKWARKETYSYTTLAKLIQEDDRTYRKITSNYDRFLGLLNYLKERYQNQLFYKQIKTFIIRDFFAQERARLESEILIEVLEQENKVRIGALLDYEESWQEMRISNYYIGHHFRMDLTEENCVLFIQKDDVMQEALAKMMAIDIVKLLEEVVEEHQIRLIDYDQQFFKNHADKVKEYVRTKKLIR